METFHPTSRKFNIYICAPLKLNNSTASGVKNCLLTWIDREHSPTNLTSDTLDSTVKVEKNERLLAISEDTIVEDKTMGKGDLEKGNLEGKGAFAKPFP